MNLPKTKVITEKIPRGYRLKEVFKNDKFVENSDVSTTASRTTISADGVITRHPMPGVSNLHVTLVPELPSLLERASYSKDKGLYEFSVLLQEQGKKPTQKVTTPTQKVTTPTQKVATPELKAKKTSDGSLQLPKLKEPAKGPKDSHQNVIMRRISRRVSSSSSTSEKRVYPKKDIIKNHPKKRTVPRSDTEAKFCPSKEMASPDLKNCSICRRKVEIEPQVLQPKVITPQSVPPRMKPANVVSEKDGRKKSSQVTVRKPFNISEEGKNTLRSIFERGEGPFAPKTEVQTMAAKKGKEVVAAKRGKEVVAVNEGREVVAVNEGRAVVAINEGRAVVAFNEGREVVPRVDVPNDVDVWEILRHWALQKLRHWVQVIDDHYAYSLIILVATALYLAYVLFYDVSDHMNKEWKYLAKMKSAAAPMRVFYYVMRAIKAPIF